MGKLGTCRTALLIAECARIEEDHPDLVYQAEATARGCPAPGCGAANYATRYVRGEPGYTCRRCGHRYGVKVEDVP